MDSTPVVEYCLNNVDADAYRTLVTTNATQQYCLQRCGVCHEEPFLVVNGQVKRGTSHESMLAGEEPIPETATVDDE